MTFTDDPASDYEKAIDEYESALLEYQLMKFMLETYYDNVRSGRQKKEPFLELISISNYEDAKRRLAVARARLDGAEKRL